MRSYLLASIMVASHAATTLWPAAASAQRVRQVELISMTGTTAGAYVGDDARPESLPSASSLPEAFRVHDLSRRYVEYRMSQAFAGAVEAPISQAVGAVSATDPLVAPVSSIVVPGWMRSAYPVSAAISYSPGCTPLAYRPAGFLGRDAESRRSSYYGMMSAIACEHGIPTGLFDALIIRESGYNPLAVSPKKAFGFAQLIPGTATELGVNPYDPAQNMRGGARYLRQQLDRFGQVHLALAAYNAGPGRVRNGLIPQISETKAYVANIIANWSKISGQPSPLPPHAQTIRQDQRQVSLTSF